MKYRFLPAIFCFYSFILFLPSYSFPQIDWLINSEFGLFRSSGYGILKKEGLLSRLDGTLSYKYETDTRTASASIRARPEFYSFDNPVNSIKLKAEGSFYQLEEKFNWGLNLSRQRNFFNDDVVNLTYDVFALVGNASWFYFDKMPLNILTGYAYQVIKGDEDYNLDLLFIDCKLLKTLSPEIRFGYGLYLERFFIENKIQLINILTNNDNNGWRIGPQLSLNYLGDLIVNIDYRLLIHESDYTEYFSYEHWVRLIAGKIFFSDWSAFLLVDYNSFFFKKSENFVEGSTPLYTPLNLENRIYLKIAYEINESFALYTKSGYFKDNLYEDKFSLEGWNAMIGIELNGGI